VRYLQHICYPKERVVIMKMAVSTADLQLNYGPEFWGANSIPHTSSHIIGRRERANL
jgi:hypothetical protein